MLVAATRTAIDADIAAKVDGCGSGTRRVGVGGLPGHGARAVEESTTVIRVDEERAREVRRQVLQSTHELTDHRPHPRRRRTRLLDLALHLNWGADERCSVQRMARRHSHGTTQYGPQKGRGQAL